MKKIFATFATTLVATSVSAGGIYSGFGQDNPDLSIGYASGASEVTAVQPGVGADFGRYHGWAIGNADLFDDNNTTPPSHDSGTADVYRGFDGNPDL